MQLRCTIPPCAVKISQKPSFELIHKDVSNLEIQIDWLPCRAFQRTGTPGTYRWRIDFFFLIKTEL